MMTTQIVFDDSWFPTDAEPTRAVMTVGEGEGSDGGDALHIETDNAGMFTVDCDEFDRAYAILKGERDG